MPRTISPQLSLTLGLIAQKLETFSTSLQAIDKHPPPIWMTPSQHIQFFAVASETLLDREAREFANPAAAAVQERSELADMTELDARPIYRYDLKSREYTVLHSFAALDANGANEDGANPGVALTRGPVFYGMASFGGTYGNDTVFRIDCRRQFHRLARVQRPGLDPSQ